MWRVIKNMYNITKSAVLLEGEISKPFNIGQGVVQGCNILPILFFIFINQCLDEVEKAGIGITVKKNVNVIFKKDVKIGKDSSRENLELLMKRLTGRTSLASLILQQLPLQNKSAQRQNTEFTQTEYF